MAYYRIWYGCFCTLDAGRDAAAADPCVPVVRREVAMEALALDGVPYPYRADPDAPLGFRFYRRSVDAGGLVAIPDRDPVVGRLLPLAEAAAGAAG